MPFMQENGEYYVSNQIDLEDRSDDLEMIANSTDCPDGVGEEDEDDEIQFEQAETESIELPPQRRCFSHLLNLISGDFETR